VSPIWASQDLLGLLLPVELLLLLPFLASAWIVVGAFTTRLERDFTTFSVRAFFYVTELTKAFRLCGPRVLVGS